MSRPGAYTRDIFRLADECIRAGLCPGFEDGRYVLLLVWDGEGKAEIHRAHVNCVLPTPCRVWMAKGRRRVLLGESEALPVDLRDGVNPPFLG